MNHLDILCFKSYDLRGKVPTELNEDVAYRVGRAYVDFLKAKTVVVGHDIRLSSESLTKALIEGITDAGADVSFIGECGTEEVYFGTFHLNADGGICITASHNPIDYNGMKLVRQGSRPVSSDNGLLDIKEIAEKGVFTEPANKGSVTAVSLRDDYVTHLLEYIDVSQLKPLRIVCNAGNGGAGAVIDALEPHLPFEFIKVHHDADGNFPNGIPNPLLPERRQATTDAVKEHQADFGIAWDGDFDRCFFFDEAGNFIEGYYLVGLLAKSFLQKSPGSTIVHDPRLTWNTVDEVKQAGGIPMQSKTGHAFIKASMREHDAIYGGEMSAHHYFRDFAYCDNGNIPWLLVAELISQEGNSLSTLVNDRVSLFPCSGEINNTVSDPKLIMQRIHDYYLPYATHKENVDGLSMAFSQWRFNLRMSSTEPVLRLNVESRQDVTLMKEKTAEMLDFIKRFDLVEEASSPETAPETSPETSPEKENSEEKTQESAIA
ncbi:Phosphomannomutase/phosphoglucomutase [Thalassocella blandensis]|nr:Phosphomannomutase/phosphoglucomutase [Thalassocella blandensis]